MSRQKKSELVQKVFRWVAVAKRPLTLDEIREAVYIDIGQQSLETERLVRQLTPIVMWSENLLQVTEEQPPTIEFAHSTICEFITKGDLPIQLSNFHIDVYEADHFVGEICITYLHLNNFKTTVARRLQPVLVNPMAIASTSLRRGQKTPGLTSRIADVFGQSKAKADLDLAGALASYNRADASEGDDEAIAIFLDNRCSMLCINRALQVASEGGHVKIVERLLEAQADVNAAASRDGGRTALQAASEGGHIQVVERLLEAQADVNAAASRDGGRTALQAASAGGHIQVVERLLEAQADINAAACLKGGWTALQAASAGGHIQVVERLLEAGATLDEASHFLLQNSGVSMGSVISPIID
ncbi:hypothetical protein ACHAO7_011433 [Fusarium culmorum]